MGTPSLKEKLDSVHRRMAGVTEADILQLLNVEVEQDRTGTDLVESTRVFTWGTATSSIQHASASTPTVSSPA